MMITAFAPSSDYVPRYQREERPEPDPRWVAAVAWCLVLAWAGFFTWIFGVAP